MFNVSIFNILHDWLFVKSLRQFFAGKINRQRIAFRMFHSVDLHGKTAFFFDDRHARIPHAPHHHERLFYGSFQGDFKGVFGDLPGHAFSHLRFNFKEPVRRGHAADALVRTLKIVVLHIQRQLFLEVVKGCDFRFVEKFQPQCPPEPFHFAVGLRMVRTADRVLDIMIPQICSELIIPRPADELTPAVGQDFFGKRIIAAGFFEQVKSVGNGLTVKQIERNDVPRIIVQIPDDKDFLTVRHDEIHYIGVPKFIGRMSLKKTNRRRGRLGLARCKR